jgi:hypothetical protein
MNHPPANDSPQVAETPISSAGERETGASRAPSRSLAWAITLGEAILWGTLAWFFADYWLMLPVRYRVGGILFLASLAGAGIFRLVRFHRRLARVNRHGMKTRPPERRSD